MNVYVTHSNRSLRTCARLVVGVAERKCCSGHSLSKRKCAWEYSSGRDSAYLAAANGAVSSSPAGPEKCSLGVGGSVNSHLLVCQEQ